jgi:N-acetylglucosaminyldiphosphoundecaprenol N-acetyl-beta-D-mannosaminyltransferase
VVELALDGRGGDVHLCNAFTLALADKDSTFRRELADAELNLPDGMSVVWAARRFASEDARMSGRVYGPDLLLEVLERGGPHQLRHYFYGGADEAVLAAFLAEVRTRFPSVVVAGAEVPPYEPLTESGRRDLLGRIASSRAQLVWVGLGTPKQDRVCADLRRDSAAIFVAVGAAYDFLAGVKSQAPSWMQQRGLEWAYRLGQEPRRLWKRYLLGNTRFVWAAAVKDRRR